MTLYNKNIDKEIKANKALTVGQVVLIDTTISRTGGHDIDVFYTYFAKKKQYRHYINFYRKVPYCKASPDCLNKKYIVEYSTINPQHSRILLDKPLEDTVVSF